MQERGIKKSLEETPSHCGRVDSPGNSAGLFGKVGI